MKIHANIPYRKMLVAVAALCLAAACCLRAMPRHRLNFKDVAGKDCETR